MLKLVSNIRIRTRLILAFVLISSIVLFVGIREFFVFKSLESNQNYIVKSFDSSFDIMEAKYNLKTDIQVLMELLLSTEADKVDENWNRHNTSSDKLCSALISLIDTLNSKERLFHAERTTINTLSKQIYEQYKSAVKPLYQKIYETKKEQIVMKVSVPEIVEENLIKKYDDPFSNNETPDLSVPKTVGTKGVEDAINQDIRKLRLRIDSLYTSINTNIDKIDKLTNTIVKASQNKSTHLINVSIKTMVVIFILSLLIFLFIAWAMSNMILVPIENLKGVINKLSKGILIDKIDVEGTNEISDIQNAINQHVNGLRKISNFSVEIGKGNFDSDFKPSGRYDVLGNSLLEMRKSLKHAAEEEVKRKTEDKIRNFQTDGLSKFTEVLRDETDIKKLSESVIQQLVKYVGAIQGGLFVYNDENPKDTYLELFAAFAYDRKKFMHKIVKPKEGLLGACLLEKETIYVTEIPEDYLEIQSGLGESIPRSILIVPIKKENTVQGVMEFASFKEFLPYEITFIEKAAETVATTFAGAKMNLRTAELLRQSREQTELMQAQEEQMRQNMEEMQAAQEESERKEIFLMRKVEQLETLLNKNNIEIPKGSLSEFKIL